MRLCGDFLGGQRQRVSLARTLLKDPPILILDEATSIFDPLGEVSFIEEYRELLSQRTVILITHRPASLALASGIQTYSINTAINMSRGLHQPYTYHYFLPQPLEQAQSR